MSDEKDNKSSEKPEVSDEIRSKSGFDSDGGLSGSDRSIIEQYASEEENSADAGEAGGADTVSGLQIDEGGLPEQPHAAGGFGEEGGEASPPSETENTAPASPSGRVPPPVTSEVSDFSASDDVGVGDDGFTSFDDVSGFDDEADFGEEGYDFSEGIDDEDSEVVEAVVAAGKKSKVKSGGGVGKRFVAPIAVLLAAGGVGGYIVMNPDVIGGGSSPKVVSGSVTTPVQMSGAGMNALSEGVGESAPVVNRAELDRPIGADAGAAKIPETLNDGPEYPVDVAGGDVPRPPEMQAEPFFDDTEGGSIDSFDEENVTDDFISGFDGEPEITSDAFDEPVMDDVAAAAKPVEPVDQVVTPDEEILDEPEEAMFEAVEEKSVEPIEEMKLASADPVEKPPVKRVETPVAPDESSLNKQKKPPASPYGGALVDDSSDRTSVGAAAIRTAQPETGSKKYFDASAQIPTGRMATDIGPRKVDPVLEPAQKYVIVTGSKKENDPESMLVSANRALKLQRYDAAVEMFEQLYDRNSRDPRILMGLAVALQHADRAESALMVYDELLDIAPGNREAIINMLGLLRKQYPSVAVRRLLDLQNEYPNDPMIAAQLGVTRADMRDYDEAEKYLGIAISLEPHNAQHYLNMAIIADRQGNKGDAVSYYEEALQVDAVYGNSRSIQREVIYDRLSVLRR